MVKIQKYQKFIVANWKLNGSINFTKEYLRNLNIYNSDFISKCLVICPPAPFCEYISKNSKDIFMGAQDCSLYDEGAYTGEISVKILKDVGCDFCILGHSERRNIFNETNHNIFTKANNCINNQIVPIICVGETLEQKNQNLTKEIISQQIINCVPKNAKKDSLIIAYEPIWAIGSGITPTIEEIDEIHTFIKSGIANYESFKLIYGGSVKSSNSKEIMDLQFVDGLLVGGASLNIDEFNKIIMF